MNQKQLPLEFHEKVIFDLRELYNSFGYGQYTMSKFEEYDLYAKNKDFLISDSVITFMDLGGKLMALKPDVTLSIVKNTKDLPDTVQKLYYNENIYRVAKGTGAFREMRQIGLECLGDIDSYCITEVLTLAVKSLEAISEEYVLNVSHLGLLTKLLEKLGIDNGGKEAVLEAIGEKNTHDLQRICVANGVSEDNAKLLANIMQLTGEPMKVLSAMETMAAQWDLEKEIAQARSVFCGLPAQIGDRICFDFSVVDDIHYYNGVVFKGFLAGIPSSVLSGGQYDKLMRKMNRRSNAIGFAVYMDALERLCQQKRQLDVDVVLLYQEGLDLQAIHRQAQKLRQEGKTVLVTRTIPEGLRYAQLCKLTKEGMAC